MRLTKIQIIDETVEHYTNNPRAISKTSGNCHYVTEDGIHCAHSRCLTDEAREKLIEDGMNFNAADNPIKTFGDDIHQEKYQGHDFDFWIEIQSLHDTSAYWKDLEIEERGLTLLGEVAIKELKEKYENQN